MNIFDTTKQIIRMYQLSENPSQSEWNAIFKNFDSALESCNEPDVLSKCILYDKNWYLPFEYRLKIMEKAKSLGANSYDFLADYYSYKLSFLDPGEEFDEALFCLDNLNKNQK